MCCLFFQQITHQLLNFSKNLIRLINRAYKTMLIKETKHSKHIVGAESTSMAAGAVSMKNLTKCETARKLKKELIRLIICIYKW